MRYKDLSIHKKILLTNFLMIIIPVIIVCIIFASVLIIFSTITDSSSFLIRNVLLNSSNYGPTLLIKSLNDELSESTTINDQAKAIFKELEKANLHIMITQDDEILYISEGFTQKRIQSEFKEIAQTVSYKKPYILWNQNGMAYASTIENKAHQSMDITFSGTTLKLPKDSYASWESTKLWIKIMIVIAGFVMIVFILLLGIFLTKRLSRHILVPLSKLQQATKDIKEGQMDTTITKDSFDEFGELCENFEAMRAQLVASNELQQQYELQRKELIAGISHDLSTPLTSIDGYVNGLLDGIADTKEKQIHYLEIIRQKTQQMNDLVDQLFLLSKLDMKEEPIHTSYINLNDFLEDWVEEKQYQNTMESHSITYTPYSDAVYVMIDPSLFIRVFDNLLENSIKYQKDEPLHIDISISVQHTNCIITFKDNGIGASKEDIAHLFERFYRADRARSSKIKGSGLGLAITRHIIDQMQGSIHADGNINEGLCIQIQLPVQEEKK